MEIAQYIRVLVKQWWVIACATIAVLIATYILTIVQQPIYQSESSLMIVPSPTLREFGSILQGLDTLDRGGSILETYRALVTSQTVVQAAGNDTSLSDQELERYTITGENPRGATIITIFVTGPDPGMVIALNNQLALQTVRFGATVYAPYEVQILDRAAAPAKLVSPKLLQNMLLGLILGISLGLVLVFLNEYLRLPEEAALQQNIIDPVTGVYTKTFFMQRLNQELARCKSHNYNLSLGLLHVGNLEQLRKYRASGPRDPALKQVACFLASRLRPEDLIAQVGRDRFAILFPDLTSETAEESLKRLQGYLEWAAFDIEPSHTRLGVRSSSGLISYRAGLGADDMMSKAEQALQVAGTNGHQRVHLWQEQEFYVG